MTEKWAEFAENTKWQNSKPAGCSFQNSQRWNRLLSQQLKLLTGLPGEKAGSLCRVRD